ncbi:MAG: copper transporter [Flavobacteriales bacterium CG_4_9_14_3_um_filter_32_8]|nr:MAG: copper transporter [Flavobacteriales bacterium CG_4_9_14_3_um_filter_32_8]
MQEDKSNGLKSFGLTTLSVKNKTTVFVLTVIIFVAGVISYVSMPREAFPEIVIPEIYVGTPYPGNSPEDIEKLITRPLEKEIKSISGIDKISSTSIQGYSSIRIEFDFSVTPAQALLKVKDAVDKAKSDADFPDDLPADPNVFEMNFSELMPVMNINLSGDFSPELLKDYAEIIEDRVEDLPQITKVDIRGIQEKEVKIKVNVQKMESMQISYTDIENAVGFENMTISGGDIILDDLRRTVRTAGDFTDWKEIENIIIKHEKGNIVYLRDVAEVVFEEKDRESYAREFGQPVVMCDVFKRGGQNLLEASDAINEIITELKKTEFPENLHISITSDMSTKTRTQVNELENNILFGMLLVVGVLLFFLGLRNALFVGIAIPMSMFMAFMVLNAVGVTLNMMVLFSLILALGMLVDNGIVIVENIYRLVGEGYSLKKASIYGAGEVAWPIISSTATTLAAFIPLAIWPGKMGEFMKYLPITLMIVLGSSLFVALIINPVLTSVFMKLDEKSSNRKKIIIISIAFILFGLIILLAGAMLYGNILMAIGLTILTTTYFFNPATIYFQNKILPQLENFYHRFLTYVLKGKNPIKWVVGTFVLLILSFILIGVASPKVEFFPVNMPNYINIFIEQPIGTDITATNKIAQQVEEKVMNYFNTEIVVHGEKIQRKFMVESIIGQVGAGTSDPAQGVSMGETPNKARITISFVKFSDRKGIKTNQIMNDIRAVVNDIPGVQITVDKDKAGPPQGKAINIELYGDDYNALIDEAEKMKHFINQSNVYGVEELKLDIQTGKPEIVVNVDRQKAKRFSLSTAQIGSAIRTSLFGKEISKYKEGEDDYKIILRMNDASRYNMDNLMNQKITFRDPSNGKISQVPISAVAKVEKTSTFSAIQRKDLKRTISIQSNVIEGANPTEVVTNIKALLKTYPKDSNYSWKIAGQQEEQAKEMSFLSKALLIAVFLIFLIIVAQFNSISAPVIIVTSVVFSLIGVFLGLVIFQMDFIVMMTMIGIISLAGIVVNNAIVLLDYTKLIIERKKLEQNIEKLPMSELVEAIIEGGETRLRPVLLTAITTILGLMPLAVGMNIDFFTLFTELDPQIYFGGDNVVFWGPMSWTIIFGLTFATFLTLVIVPVMFLLIEKLKYRVL